MIMNPDRRITWRGRSPSVKLPRGRPVGAGDRIREGRYTMGSKVPRSRRLRLRLWPGDGRDFSLGNLVRLKLRGTCGLRGQLVVTQGDVR